MKFTDLIPNPDMLLELEPEELAGYILEYFNKATDVKPNRSTFSSSRTIEDYPPERMKECQHALMEAWVVLEQEGLVAHRPEDDNAWFFVTRRGEKIKSHEDFNSFRHASLFPKESIHLELTNKVYPLFLRGDYETAIFQAFKTIEVRVRESTHELDKKLYGVDLMRKAFNPENGPLADLSEPIAEREALQALFAGAIGRFKNPSSHRHVPITSPTETIEVLLFASHLLRIVDERTNIKRARDGRDDVMGSDQVK